MTEFTIHCHSDIPRASYRDILLTTHATLLVRDEKSVAEGLMLAVAAQQPPATFFTTGESAMWFPEWTTARREHPSLSYKWTKAQFLHRGAFTIELKALEPIALLLPFAAQASVTEGWLTSRVDNPFQTPAFTWSQGTTALLEEVQKPVHSRELQPR